MGCREGLYPVGGGVVSDWELRRVIDGGNNLFDRNADPQGGQAVVYGASGRRLIGYINGAYFEVPYPDTGPLYGGDRGNPIAVRLRFDHASGRWALYVFMFSGDTNPRNEWVMVL